MNKSSRIVTLTVTAVLVVVLFIAIWVVKPAPAVSEPAAAQVVSAPVDAKAIANEVKQLLAEDEQFKNALASGASEAEIHDAVARVIEESNLATSEEVGAIVSESIDQLIDKIMAMLPLTEAAKVVQTPALTDVEVVEESEYQAKRTEERKAAIDSILASLIDY